MKNEKIWACLCHLGYNMWGDPEEQDGIKGYYYGKTTEVAATTRLRFRRETWDKIVDKLHHAGCNMIVLDIGEGIRFDCAPELAADLVDRGIVLSGGSAQLRGLDKLLAQETGLPITELARRAINFAAENLTWADEE